ncbi:DNA polymerase Y family protein [Glaciecola sp. MH2013]|uniref:Y-family DNA polymerase n=1 Tax=Glaciecola sp. MH2013 TaxID=2785524 RepID=UPI00189EB4A4|nr:DNA polymerase Y family protein [Glaciecola sp. MH2013]MBF7073330.1 DNA polymerase Y family protein [Glaciecola sp. MH2013]
MQFDTSSLWIYLYLPNLQLDLQRNEVDTKPSIIYEPRSNQVVQLNQAAQNLGLSLGMGLASASILSNELVITEYKQEFANQALQRLANDLYLVTSDIAIDEPYGIYLRAQNMLKLYGGLAEYWHVLEQVLSKYNFRMYYASAYSVNVAKLLAKHHLRFISDNKEVIRSRLQKCTLQLSDIDEKDIEKLHRVGIKTLDNLLIQPISALASRLSRASVSVVAGLRGEAPVKLCFYQPPETYRDYLELLYDIQLIDKLLPVIKRCLDGLESYLLVRNALALNISLQLHQREHEPIEQVINSALPLYKSADWLDIIALRFESISLSSAVYGITLCCEKIEKADICESDFFSEKSTHVAAMTLLSRLRAKLGKQKVNLLEYCDDYRPENVNQYLSEKQSSGSQLKVSQTKDSSAPSLFNDRPGLLLSEPIPLTSKVTILNGPERISSGWWDDAPIERDYFLAQNTKGQQLWLFRTPQDKWYVHGYFI